MNPMFNYGVEVGSGDSFSSILYKNTGLYKSILLIEPNKLLFKDLKEKIVENNVHANLLNVGISSISNEIDFFNFGYCSFLRGYPSFLKLSCEEDAENFWQMRSESCNCINFSIIDNGNIDYLVLTCNGAELDVLNNMTSRPKIIKTKYYCHNHLQVYFYNEISKWMRLNSYSGKLIKTNRYKTYHEIDFIKNE